MERSKKKLKPKDDYENCYCEVERRITCANVCHLCGGTVGFREEK